MLLGAVLQVGSRGAPREAFLDQTDDAPLDTAGRVAGSRYGRPAGRSCRGRSPRGRGRPAGTRRRRCPGRTGDPPPAAQAATAGRPAWPGWTSSPPARSSPNSVYAGALQALQQHVAREAVGDDHPELGAQRVAPLAVAREVDGRRGKQGSAPRASAGLPLVASSPIDSSPTGGRSMPSTLLGEDRAHHGELEQVLGRGPRRSHRRRSARWGRPRRAARRRCRAGARRGYGRSPAATPPAWRRSIRPRARPRHGRRAPAGRR